jgi:predicted DCC family thiol-disulfide oxidoreductase YuxK
VLARYGRDPNDLDTVYVVADHGRPEERLLWRSRAIVFALTQLGGLWSAAVLLRVVPTRVLDVAYGWVAKSRYGWFGKLDACLVPTPRDRAKFLDVG